MVKQKRKNRGKKKVKKIGKGIDSLIKRVRVKVKPEWLNCWRKWKRDQDEGEGGEKET